MVIAGLQKSSLIDYPGKVSCVVFVSGCNFTCPYCHNPALARGEAPHPMDVETVMAFIERRRGFLDGVVITGGEPTLWPGLDDLCRDIRSTGLAVKLDTNGSRPDVLSRLLQDGRVNYIAMDLKTAPQGYGPAFCPPRTWPLVAQSIDHIMHSNVPYEFRTTCARPFVDDALIRPMAEAIAGARRYVLQTFRPDTMLDPGFFNGIDPAFTPQQINTLQAIAAPLVESCSVR